MAVGPDGRLLKVAGVLGETALLDDVLDSAVVGIGVNGEWRARDFPPELAASMTSLFELSGGRPISRDALLDGWLARLEPRYEALRVGAFDAGAWTARQRTTGHRVEVEAGGELVAGRAVGVDPESGALLVHDRMRGIDRPVGSGEVVRCRIVELPARQGDGL